jgi:glyoxylase-like metal-dependent hydrolase (beta-lactamase superfamily II)
MFVIDTGRGLAVIDTAMDENSIDALEKGLVLFGFSLDDVRYVFITHCHTDHVGGLANLQSRANVTTYAHTIEAPIIRGNSKQTFSNPGDLPNPIDKLMLSIMTANGQDQVKSPANVDIEVTDGDVLESVFTGLTVVHLPGHSSGQVGYWLAEQKILFGGDCAMNFFGRMTAPFRAPASDWNAAKQSMKKAAALQPEILCLGHGPVITENTAAKFQKLADRF